MALTRRCARYGTAATSMFGHWPSFSIYAIYHVRLGILSIGVTNLAPAQYLRKHMTDVLAGTAGASLHRLMFAVEMSGWVLRYWSM